MKIMVSFKLYKRVKSKHIESTKYGWELCDTFMFIMLEKALKSGWHKKQSFLCFF